jgi:hypothetical protein
MKIDRFNVPDFNSFNEVKNNQNEAARPDFSARLENLGATNQTSAASPLQNQLTGIAKGTDFNNSISSRVAVDQATRAIVGGLISPDLKNRLDLDAMMSAISDFAQNDPVIAKKLQNLLVRLS